MCIRDRAKAHGISEDEVLEKVMLAPQAIKRLVEPEEVAEMVAFLIGPFGGSVTGVAVPMEMGWTAK